MSYKQTDFSKFGAECFSGLVGIEILQVTTNFAAARMGVKKRTSHLTDIYMQAAL